MMDIYEYMILVLNCPKSNSDVLYKLKIINKTQFI